jgi:hypothetical protein
VHQRRGYLTRTFDRLFTAVTTERLVVLWEIRSCGIRLDDGCNQSTAAARQQEPDYASRDIFRAAVAALRCLAGGSRTLRVVIRLKPHSANVLIRLKPDSTSLSG